MTIWEMLNTKLGLLVVGFVLTTLVGSGLARIYENMAMERQLRFKVFELRFEGEQALLSEFHSNIQDFVGSLYETYHALSPLEAFQAADRVSVEMIDRMSAANAHMDKCYQQWQARTPILAKRIDFILGRNISSRIVGPMGMYRYRKEEPTLNARLSTIYLAFDRCMRQARDKTPCDHKQLAEQFQQLHAASREVDDLLKEIWQAFYARSFAFADGET